ncbi:lasso peptide biosynthesis B2 protein [Azospirillum sp. sgz301742]
MTLTGLLELRRWPWRFLVLEAVVWLAAASLALRLVPFRRLAPLLGPVRPSSPADDGPDPDEAQERQARRVGAAVARATRFLPWEALCLPQAMAAKAMLARRGLRTTLHLGAMPDQEKGGLSAHAWLMLGPLTVTGGATRPGYAELARFG